MPRKQWINKKTAQHFTLVHRPLNDPLIHDESAPSMVLNPTNNLNASKSKQLGDLASELGAEASHIRANEGEAANHGVFFDDTEYDYMQHLRDLGDGSAGGEVVFLEADTAKNNKDKGKGKQKQSLDSALRQLDLQTEDEKNRELFGDDFLPSRNLQRQTYQSMQDVPDVIGGFQPDMDPRLREVLEALEDEAYVDNDDDEDIFQALAKDGEEIDEYEFEELVDEGWETDDTARPASEYRISATADDNNEVPDLVHVPDADADEEAEAADKVNWMEDFNAFKKDQKDSKKKLGPAPPSQSDLQSSLMTTTTNGGRRKKRKGALTDISSYSMTSSSLVRTEQLGILDARFEKLEEQYNADMDDDGSVSAISSVSSVTGPVRSDFDSVLDEFLGGHAVFAKKHVRKGWKNGTEQLDEIRRELGPARIRGKTSTSKKAGAR